MGEDSGAWDRGEKRVSVKQASSVIITTSSDIELGGEVIRDAKESDELVGDIRVG